MPATMLVFAHPDDESIALGGRMSRFADACLVQVTDGAPRNQQDSHAYGFACWQDYRRARRREFCEAMKLAGLSGTRCEFLEISDQEATAALAPLTRRIAELIEQQRPACIVTHPYEGGHPDHDACAFAVHHAVKLLREAQSGPAILEAAFYHAQPDGMATGSFSATPCSTAEIMRVLTAQEQARKQTLLACYATQRQTLSYFPIDCERFRVAPQYDFLRPPNSGSVFYDQYPWGMNSQRFCAMAREATAELFPHGIPA